MATKPKEGGGNTLMITPLEAKGEINVVKVSQMINTLLIVPSLATSVAGGRLLGPLPVERPHRRDDGARFHHVP
jgi:hypothetical protein